MILFLVYYVIFTVEMPRILFGFIIRLYLLCMFVLDNIVRGYFYNQSSKHHTST